MRDDKKAAHSPTWLVASALACGFKYGTDKSFMESYEEVDVRFRERHLAHGCLHQVPFTWVEDQTASP